MESDGEAKYPARLEKLDRKAVAVTHNSEAGDAKPQACRLLVSATLISYLFKLVAIYGSAERRPFFSVSTWVIGL